MKFFILLPRMLLIEKTSIFQAVYESKLDEKLEKLLLKLLENNSTPNVQEIIRQFLTNYQISSENFWDIFNKSGSYEESLDSYYQFSKNQCTLVENLLDNLNIILNKNGIQQNMATMLRDGFTF